MFKSIFHSNDDINNNAVKLPNVRTLVKSTNFNKNELLIIYELFCLNCNSDGLLSYKDSKSMIGHSITPMYLYIISREIEMKQISQDSAVNGLDLLEFINILSKLHEKCNYANKCNYLFDLLKYKDDDVNKEYISKDLYKKFITFISYNNIPENTVTKLVDEIWNNITDNNSNKITSNIFVRLCGNLEIESLMTIKIV